MFLYLLFGIPALLLSLYAQFKVKSTFKKYAKVHSGRGITGADAARRIFSARRSMVHPAYLQLAWQPMRQATRFRINKTMGR